MVSTMTQNKELTATTILLATICLLIAPALSRPASEKSSSDLFKVLRERSVTEKNVTEDALLKRMKRMAYRDQNYPLSIWSEGVPFRISPDLPPHAVKMILKATQFWNDNTCIDFTENGNGPHRIDFIRGIGCYSNIGRVWFKEKQDLSVGQECEHFHTIAHELAHGLGLFHTQNRPDRENYVDIHQENAERSQQTNFRVESSAACTSYDLPYEYGSVMHYRASEFSNNNKPTVVAKQALHKHTMGSGTGPSFLDVLLINMHYNCQDRCKDATTKCENGGYPHPRDCTKCICPSGFAGQYCDQMIISPICGGLLPASKNPTTFTFQLGAEGLRDDMHYCYWWITAPKDAVVAIEIVELEAPCWDGCLFGGLEIKAEPDKRLTGYRFCCGEKQIGTIAAYGEKIPIILFNRKDSVRFRIKFWIASKDEIMNIERKTS